MRNKLIKNAAFLGGIAGDYRLSLPVFRLLGKRYRDLCGPDTELCIDGFPRSGNTFLVAAVQRWNTSLRISHHTHLGGNVKYAIGLGLPTVVLLRQPADAVASAMVWDGKVTPAVGLFVYMHFYRSLAPLLDKALLVSFEDAVGKPDAVVQAVNDRFGRSFEWREFNSEEEGHIRRYLVRHDARNERDAARSTLPNPEKRALKTAAMIGIDQCALLGRAEALWHELSSRCIET
jgi:hypothetical protein